MKTNTKVPKTPFFAAFSVGAVLFSAHAGGGFATGNQANTYYVPVVLPQRTNMLRMNFIRSVPAV